MKPTLEQIQDALSDQLNMNRGGMTIEKFLEKHDAKITYALTLAEQVAKGEVVLEQPWQPIETAPKDGSSFLTYDQGEYYECWWSNVLDSFTTYPANDYSYPCLVINYWKPLPLPPQEASE